MAAHSGETANATGTFKCDNCGETVRIQKGERIPKCPNCGNETYGERRAEPKNPSTRSKGD